MHHIYTTRKWKHRHYDPVWDFRQKSQNISANEMPVVSEEEIVELLICENLNESMEDLNMFKDGQRTFLNGIIEKLEKCGRKMKWQNVTPRDLYINPFDTLMYPYRVHAVFCNLNALCRNLKENSNNYYFMPTTKFHILK